MSLVKGKDHMQVKILGALSENVLGTKAHVLCYLEILGLVSVQVATDQAPWPRQGTQFPG